MTLNKDVFNLGVKFKCYVLEKKLCVVNEISGGQEDRCLKG